jgi:thioredoxin 1
MLAASTLGQPYDIRFAPPAAGQFTMALRAELDDLQVSGTSMGISGTVQANVVIKVLPAEQGAKTVKLQVDLKDLKVVLNGAEQAPPNIPTSIIEVDDRGRLVSLQSTGNLAATDLMSTAGMPANLLAVALFFARLPDKPVALGDDWRIEDQYPTPFGAVAAAVFTGKLLSVADGNAALATTIEAAVPDFQATNPMQPGTQMTVKDCKLLSDLPRQLVALDTGMVREAGGHLNISLNADVGGMTLPANVAIFLAGAQDDAAAQKLLADAKKPKPAAPKPKTGAAPGAATAKSGVISVTSADFEEKVVRADKPVFVDFYADWCGPCKRQAPIVEILARKYQGKMLFARVNTDDCTDLAGRFKVEAIPTLVILRDGVVGWRAVGLRSEADLTTAIDKALKGG